MCGGCSGFCSGFKPPENKAEFFSNRGICGGFKTAGNFRRKI
jgi:hypothetical protein